MSAVFLTFQNTVQITQPTSLCVAIKNNLTQLTSGGKTTVRLKGYLTTKDGFFSFSDANRNDCADNYADMWISDEGNLNVETQSVIQEASRLTDESNLARVEVEVIGTLEEQSPQGPISSRFLIRAVEVKHQGSIQVISHSQLAKEAKESR